MLGRIPYRELAESRAYNCELEPFLLWKGNYDAKMVRSVNSDVKGKVTFVATVLPKFASGKFERADFRVESQTIQK